jgi:hypothetical protein
VNLCSFISIPLRHLLSGDVVINLGKIVILSLSGKNRNNPLKPGGYCLYHHISGSKLHILPTQFVYCFMCFSVEREISFHCSVQWLAFNPATACVPCAVWTGCLVLFRLNCVFTSYTIILFHLPILVIILQFGCIVNSVFMITLATYFLTIL